MLWMMLVVFRPETTPSNWNDEPADPDEDVNELELIDICLSSPF
jgi:hypothetical protein